MPIFIKIAIYATEEHFSSIKLLEKCFLKILEHHQNKFDQTPPPLILLHHTIHFFLLYCLNYVERKKIFS